MSMVGTAMHFHCVYVGFWNLVFFCESSVFLSLNLVLFRNNRGDGTPGQTFKPGQSRPNRDVW